MSKKSTTIKVNGKEITLNSGQIHTAATLGKYVGDVLGKEAFPPITPKSPKKPK